MGDAATPPIGLAVLVVDDDPTIRMLLTDAFTDRGGWTVTAVADGPAALAALDTLHPALIVLDVGLPGLDGIALYRLLRQREGLGAVPVLFVTAANRARSDGLEGSFRWLAKPFRLADLDAAVDALLGRGPEL